MGQSQGAILESSRDRREIKDAAISLAGSERPEDHAVLGRYLGSGEFLGRIDDPEDYRGSYRDLRLSRVMDVLTENRLPSTDGVFLGLIDAPGFQENVLRMQLLVAALSVVKPSPPEAVRYWDEMSRPGSPLASDVVEALCANGSEPALDLLERKFADPGHESRRKVFWMRSMILPRRNDEVMLAFCERMLWGSLPADLRPSLVEALFDYQPDEWFRGDDPPKPPPLAGASRKSRDLLRSNGERALTSLPLSETQKRPVRSAVIWLMKQDGK